MLAIASADLTETVGRAPLVILLIVPSETPDALEMLAVVNSLIRLITMDRVGAGSTVAGSSTG
ncbi:MAG: hypothetical protein WBA38_04240 [Gordonia sp. (in: high G+C Gram-positive bacteria)]|uniref:hypothetical protein n=1 Tax=Gordonia sp. (in: high G+C Gram-positive bacteria) TaxID=84139 RepID=UPI003C74A190